MFRQRAAVGDSQFHWQVGYLIAANKRERQRRAGSGQYHDSYTEMLFFFGIERSGQYSLGKSQELS